MHWEMWLVIGVGWLMLGLAVAFLFHETRKK